MAGRYAGRIIKAGGNAAAVADAAEDAAPQGAENQAQDLIDDAQRRAHQIVAAAGDEALAIVERGKVTGVAEGKIAATLKLLELSEDFQTGMTTLEADIAELVARGVERILAETPAPEKLAGVIRAAVRDLQDRRALILTVAPEDLGFVQSLVGQYQQGLTRPIRSVGADEALREGECRLTDGRSELRIDVESQLTALRAALALAEGSAQRTAEA